MHTHLGRQEDENDDEEEAVHRVVHVGEGGGLLQHEGDGGQHCGQHDEERHERADGAVLQLEDVALEESLEFVVLEAVSVEEAREAHLAVPAHRLHAVVHRAGGRILDSFSKMGLKWALNGP